MSMALIASSLVEGGSSLSAPSAEKGTISVSRLNGLRLDAYPSPS